MRTVVPEYRYVAYTTEIADDLKPQLQPVRRRRGETRPSRLPARSCRSSRTYWASSSARRRIVSIGRTAVFELIRSGRLRSVKIGGLRRIPASALADFVRQLEKEQAA
jgi:excisionase family DNA binding protein